MEQVLHWVGQVGQLFPFKKYPSAQEEQDEAEEQALHEVLQAVHDPGFPKVPVGHTVQAGGVHAVLTTQVVP